MRVAVIGARQARQGTGAYLARFCHEAGATVSAVGCTSKATASAAAEAVEALTGTRPRAGITAPEILGDDVDAVVIATPTPTHEVWLEAALRAGKHVLCEKALVWGGADPDLRAERLGRAFLEAGLVLRVNAQWPYTLPTYAALFPDTSSRPETFHMRLSPSAGGPGMFLASLPHPLSLLTSVLPDPEAEVVDPRATLTADGGHMTFGYRSGDHTARCTVELRRMEAPPRIAAYGFDGRLATRVIRATDPYTLELEGGGRSVPMPDPTPLLVRSFLDEAATGRPRGMDPAVIPGMRHLVHLMEAVPQDTQPT